MVTTLVGISYPFCIIFPSFSLVFKIRTEDFVQKQDIQIPLFSIKGQRIMEGNCGVLNSFKKYTNKSPPLSSKMGRIIKRN